MTEVAMRVKDQVIEVIEALEEADKSLDHLYKAEELLKDAKGWGIADIIGGGLFVTMIKRGKLREAQSELISARTHINKLLREMNDVRSVDIIQIRTDGVAGFVDYMGDPISDIFVQSRIEEARSRVRETIEKIEAIKERLQMMV